MRVVDKVSNEAFDAVVASRRCAYYAAPLREPLVVGGVSRARILAFIAPDDRGTDCLDECVLASLSGQSTAETWEAPAA